jgi:Trk K+ transport system NAD-binding subunit
MKFITSQLTYLLYDREMRANVGALVRYLLFLAALITLYAVIFHLIKARIEGESHSWVTGFYWTLVVMTTLGFGDVTFTSDVGRVFSIVVLLSGVILLLVMLPFQFIRLFYAPWLEARVRLRAPRELPERTAGHVAIVEYDALAAALIDRLKADGVPYVVIEPDAAKASRMVGDGVTVILGDNDARATYEKLRAGAARLVVANCEDTVNTNVTLTVREVAPDVPIAAIVESDDAAEILSLTGATWALALKRRLGESLATRADTGRPMAHVIGGLGALAIAELPARGTPFVHLRVRDTRFRERNGVSVVGLWQRGRLRPAYPDSLIPEDSVLVLAGTSPQLATIAIPEPAAARAAPLALVIGAGRVGQAAALALKKMGLPVHVLDRSARVLASLAGQVDAVVDGDASDREVLVRAGIDRAATILLTTNDDAVNIYLAVFCRRLADRVRIVSRITHERNVEAIHRAGADFVLSYVTLAVDTMMSLLAGHEPVVLGEGVRLFSVPVPPSLAGKTLGVSNIGSATGLSVVAIEHEGRLITPLTIETLLPAGAELVMLGSLPQRQAFATTFGGG